MAVNLAIYHYGDIEPIAQVAFLIGVAEDTAIDINLMGDGIKVGS